MTPIPVMPGAKYGRLTVIRAVERRKLKSGITRPYVEARCDCGNVVTRCFQLLRSGQTHSCGCFAKEAQSAHGKSKRGEFGRSLFNSLYRNYRNGAVRRKLDFCLTEEQFSVMTKKNCYYCGDEPSNILQQFGMYGHYVYNGIDRLDSAKGYTTENCVPCCKACNLAKNSMTVEQFQYWVKRIAKNFPGLETLHRPTGELFVSGVVDSFGKPVELDKAISYGWLPNLPIVGLNDKPALTLNQNLFLDQGRQLLAFCFGFRSPISDYTCQRFGIGTGITAPAVTDVSLESPITLSSVSSTTAPILGVDFLTPFVVRASYQIAIGDANGYLITERGLFSGNGTLFARHVSAAGINKTSDFSPTLTWRIRF
jgi:hypothetical protein